MARHRYSMTSDLGSVVRGFNEIKNDYNIVKRTRFRGTPKGLSSFGVGADFHFKTDQEHMLSLEWAREFDRNDPIVGQALDRLCQNVLQEGPKLDPKTGDDEVNAYLRMKWEAWSGNELACDRAGDKTLHEMAFLGLRSVMVDGDHLPLLLGSGHVQMMEAHRLRKPSNTKRNVVLGILLDAAGRAEEYWFTKAEIGTRGLSRVGDVEQISVRDKDGHRQVLHLHLKRRTSQTRGVTAFAPIPDMVQMHGDIQFAKLVQQQVVSCFGFLRTRELDFEGAEEGDAIGPRETETISDGTTRTVEDIAPGIEYIGAPGEKLEAFSPNVPNTEFFEHAALILSIISVNLGLPLQVVLLDPTKTNFSGWRGAMDQARGGFTRLYWMMVRKFYRPVYSWKVRDWLKNDEFLKGKADLLGSAVFQHDWSQPFWPYLEPSKDATADRIVVESGLNSRRRVLARRGLDIDHVDEERVADASRLIVSAIKAADEINKNNPGAFVDWRELVGADMKGLALSIQLRGMQGRNVKTVDEE